MKKSPVSGRQERLQAGQASCRPCISCLPAILSSIGVKRPKVGARFEPEIWSSSTRAQRRQPASARATRAISAILSQQAHQGCRPTALKPSKFPLPQLLDMHADPVERATNRAAAQKPPRLAPKRQKAPRQKGPAPVPKKRLLRSARPPIKVAPSERELRLINTKRVPLGAVLFPSPRRLPRWLCNRPSYRAFSNLVGSERTCVPFLRRSWSAACPEQYELPCFYLRSADRAGPPQIAKQFRD